MALIRDDKGVDHLVDIFNGGTWCGLNWTPDWEPTGGRTITCPSCLNDEERRDEDSLDERQDDDA